MKKLLSLVAAISMLLSMAACGSEKSTEKLEATETPVEETQQDEAEKETSVEEEPVSEKYSVTIDEIAKNKDFEGNECVTVNYTFTNNSDEAISFMLAIQDKAFQNGIQLTNATISYGVEEDSEIRNDNPMKEIKPGATIVCQKAYKTDDNSEVLIEITELLSFNDNIIAEKTFKLSDVE